MLSIKTSKKKTFIKFAKKIPAKIKKSITRFKLIDMSFYCGT